MVTKIGFDTYTMGFSNRPWDETIHILQTYGIQRLVDIRTLPGSRHTPQFNLENMKDALPQSEIEYIHNYINNDGWQEYGFEPANEPNVEWYPDSSDVTIFNPSAWSYMDNYFWNIYNYVHLGFN